MNANIDDSPLTSVWPPAPLPGYVVLSGSSRSDLDRFRLREVVESVKDVTKLDPHKLFVELFKATLDFRLNEDVFSRVSTVMYSCQAP